MFTSWVFAYRVRAINREQRLEQTSGHIICQTVLDRLGLSPGCDQSVSPQQPEVLGHCRNPQAKPRGQIANGPLTSE